MAEHFELLIRNGTCVLPWGMEAADVGVRNGRIAAIGVQSDATAEETVDATGLHVLPGLIDPHVHLRDPGDAAVETIPTGTRAAILGGLAAVFDMPNTSPSIVDAEKLAWKQDYVEQVAWCDMGLYVGGTKTNIPELAGLELGRGVCGIKIFAGSSTGDLMVEDDETSKRSCAPAAAASPTIPRTSTGCRRARGCSSRAIPIPTTWSGATRKPPSSAPAR